MPPCNFRIGCNSAKEMPTLSVGKDTGIRLLEQKTPLSSRGRHMIYLTQAKALSRELQFLDVKQYNIVKWN